MDSITGTQAEGQAPRADAITPHETPCVWSFPLKDLWPFLPVLFSAKPLMHCDRRDRRNLGRAWQTGSGQPGTSPSTTNMLLPQAEAWPHLSAAQCPLLQSPWSCRFRPWPCQSGSQAQTRCPLPLPLGLSNL